jgi:hypothetical protein
MKKHGFSTTHKWIPARARGHGPHHGPVMGPIMGFVMRLFMRLPHGWVWQLDPENLILSSIRAKKISPIVGYHQVFCP